MIQENAIQRMAAFGYQNNYDKQNEGIEVMTELCFRFNDFCLFFRF